MLPGMTPSPGKDGYGQGKIKSPDHGCRRESPRSATDARGTWPIRRRIRRPLCSKAFVATRGSCRAQPPGADPICLYNARASSALRPMLRADVGRPPPPGRCANDIAGQSALAEAEAFIGSMAKCSITPWRMARRTRGSGCPGRGCGTPLSGRRRGGRRDLHAP